ncbi:hypothetical protein ACLBKT_15090 [Erythrobacter sp. W302b]|uniref:hypothetical protein n=1 Tax=Erythrobacter sp. W302b TaxID=3389874 RepID=UPI00396AF5AF
MEVGRWVLVIFAALEHADLAAVPLADVDRLGEEVFARHFRAIEEHRQWVELRDFTQNPLGRLLAHSGHQEGDGRTDRASKGPHGNVLRARPAIRGDMHRPSGVGIGMT